MADSRASGPHDATKLDRIALVLQGGGALGAYQGGVYEAMQAHGFDPDWIAGTSIGAINGAIIAGNRTSDRIARLREFWDLVSETDFWPRPCESEISRRSHSLWSIWQSILLGRPGFFTPRWFDAAALFTAGATESVSFYDTRPLRRTLLRLVDFDLLNDGSTRLSVGAVNIVTGGLRYFDSRRDTLTPEHIMASGALPPGFPAVRIEGELYWDGGIYSNTPIEVVLDDVPRVNTLCLMPSLFNPAGPEPRSIAEAEKRHKDITYATRMLEHIREYCRVHDLRRSLQSIYALLPEDVKHNPEVKALADQGCLSTIHIAELIYPDKSWELAYRDADFSRAAVEQRWQFGHRDASRFFERRPWEDPVAPHTGVVVHTTGPAADTRESRDLLFR